MLFETGHGGTLPAVLLPCQAFDRGCTCEVNVRVCTMPGMH